MSEEKIKSVLGFWLKETKPEQWFIKDDAFDATIAERFGDDVENAINGDLDGWAHSQEGLVALIIMLDQFTRNIFRETSKAFAGDAKALALSLEGQKRGYLDTLGKDERYFMLMPMMHSEELGVQDASLPLFKKYTTENVYDYAVKHRDIVAEFGRFPHRNGLLGRESTPEEVVFLTQPGSSF